MQMEVNLILPLKTATNSIYVYLPPLPYSFHFDVAFRSRACVLMQICKTRKFWFLVIEEFILNSKSAKKEINIMWTTLILRIFVYRRPILLGERIA